MGISRKLPRGVAGFGRFMCSSAVCVVALAIVGCRESPTTVKGLVTLDGKPLTIGQGMRGTVVFQPTNAGGATLTGLIDASGHYELATGGSFTVTPSVYWVTVSAMELMPPTDDRPATGKLVTPAKYSSATDSGIRVQVEPGENEVNLSLLSETEVSTSTSDGANTSPGPGLSEPSELSETDASMTEDAKLPPSPGPSEPAETGLSETSAPAPK